MPTGTINKIASIAGVSIQSTISRTGTGQIGHEVGLPAGKAGSLTTRTGDGQGEVTGLPTGHGLVASDVVDIHWAGDSPGCRYSVTIDTAGANNVTFDDTPAAGGDVLPAQGTAVVVTKQVTIDTDFDGDLVTLIVVSADKAAHVQFRTVTPTVLKAQRLVANEGWDWASGQGNNPLSGNPVDHVKATNGDGAADATLKIGVLYASA